MRCCPLHASLSVTILQSEKARGHALNATYLLISARGAGLVREAQTRQRDVGDANREPYIGDANRDGPQQEDGGQSTYAVLQKIPRRAEMNVLGVAASIAFQVLPCREKHTRNSKARDT